MRYFLLLFLLTVDIVSKIGAIAWIPAMGLGRYPFGGIGVFSDFLGISFSLNKIVNTGAACGIFPGCAALLFWIRMTIITALIIYLIVVNRRTRGPFALWLVVTGAIGNALDFILYGHVIDFFHFNFWGYSFPIFNFADSYITLGVLFLFLFESFKRKATAV